MIYFSLQKQSSINKRLAEEYQHKTSLVEYLIGYKKMWELEREDEEYKNLLVDIKKHILLNPALFIKADKDYIEHMKDIFSKATSFKKK